MNKEDFQNGFAIGMASGGVSEQDYILPIGGKELGGVKNGGNVVINEDGTMTAPESEVTDEQVSSAVSDWIEANPDKVTTVQDGTITQEKLSDELTEKLGLEPNHHLTEEKVEWGFAKWANDTTWIEPTTTQSNQMITPLIRMPQYLKIVNNTGNNFSFKQVRITDTDNYDTAVAQPMERGNGWLLDTVANGETLIIPTYEIGDGSRKYLQLLGGWTYNKAQSTLEIYAIYDSYRPIYEKPSDDGVYLEDLPMRWVIQGYLGNQARLLGVVPYYPNFTYSIRGGAYETNLTSRLRAYCLFDDTIFERYQPQFYPAGSIKNPVPWYRMQTEQYDTSVNGGANAEYQWAYLTTPAETEIAPKWIAFEMKVVSVYEDDTKRTEAIQAINDGTERNCYITRWAEQMPRRIFTQIVKRNETIQDEGTRYRALIRTGDSPHANAKWVLFGDSLTDNFGGKDYGSEYFASKIAREFAMVLDNRAKSGSNIYKGGSGNYVSVSGIVMLDEYLAEIEAGTTEQADYITVAFGTNTFKTDMGTNEDTSETYTSSVYGATKYFIEKIREKVPNAVLGFVLSPRQNWGNADAQKLRDVDGARAAIREVCEDYGVPYIDMSKESGITVDMLPDGIHIKNDQSQKLYYHAMRRFMMGL
jgi:lysophospholipase L1-like esterase